MPDKKLTDSEIVKAREVSLKEQIEHYNKRRKEVIDRYYSKNTEGNEDTLEICVLRESAVLISKLESIINRLQAENERLKKAKYIFSTVDYCADDLDKALKENERLKQIIEEKGGLILIKQAKAEAYKEFAEKVKEEINEALKNNYKIRSERAQSIPIYTNDEFWNYCAGKIDCLRGIDDFLDNLLKELVGGEDNG